MSQMWASQKRAGERAPGGAVYSGEIREEFPLWGAIRQCLNMVLEN